MEGLTLGDKIEREADRLLAQIARSDTMLVAAKAGARAEGFVLGLEAGRVLNAETIEKMYIIFEATTETRLKELAST